MKNLFKKLLPALIVAIVLVCALAVTAFATDYSWVGDVNLLDMSQSGVTTTGYSDIDGNAEWTQIASASTAGTVAYKDSTAYWGWNYYAYYNATTKTMMVMPGWSGAVMSGRNNSAPVHVGESNITDTTGIDERYYTEKWANAGQYAYYAHSFETWLNEYGAQVEIIEFRPFKNQGGTGVIAEQFGEYVADDLVNLKTVKLADAFSFRSAGDAAANYNKFFENKTQLTTVQYGTFDSAGEFITECPANAVTLMEGPKTDTKYGISNVILNGCTSVTRVIIKTNTANYVGLRNNMFKNCTSLKFVYLGAPMSASYLVGTDAFTGCSGVNVYVNDISAATALAAVTGITLKAHTAYEADIESYIYGSLLTSEGILVKVADTDTEAGDNVAVRFLFRWDAANTPAAGTPVKVGVVACTADYYAGLGSGSEAEKLEALLADTNTKRVKKNDIAVYDEGKLSLKGKFLKEGTDVEKGIYCYAYTLYGIPAANYDSEIYAATYIQWADDTYYVVSNGYTDSTGADKNTISLYDVTLGLFKRGLINSEKVAEKYLWNVLKLTKTAADGQVTTNNLEYYFLPDNIDGGYVLAYKPINAASIASIPHAKTTGTPYQASVDNYLASKIIVVDYGVTKAASGSTRTFGPNWASPTVYNTMTHTLVYPVSFDLTAGTHAFNLMSGLENVIWCHTDKNGEYVPHMSDITWDSSSTYRGQLYDFRGFGTTLVQSTLGNLSNVSDASIKRNIIVASGVSLTNPNTSRWVVWAES